MGSPRGSRRARLDAGRRRRRERLGAEMALAARRQGESELDAPETWPELYEELARLPERFRAPIVLCYLEGQSYEQAASQLGCPVRTIHSRLARGRERLRGRLTRRGMAPALATLTAALACDLSRAAVSESWKQTTVATAVGTLACGGSTAIVPAAISAIAEGASRAMNLHRLMKRAAALILIGVAAGGVGFEIWARPAAREPERSSEALADDSQYRATFKHGATIEVVGISTVPTGPKTWWKPDGSPLPEPPADTIERSFKPGAGDEARVILVRVTGATKDNTYRWGASNWTGYSGGKATKNGQKATGLEYSEASFRQDRTECEIQAKLASGAWTTEAAHNGQGGTGFFAHGHKFDWGKRAPIPRTAAAH